MGGDAHSMMTIYGCKTIGFNSLYCIELKASLSIALSPIILCASPSKFELNPSKNNENLKDRLYFYAPMEYGGRILPVKITIKQYSQKGVLSRLYSIEAIDVGL